MPIRTNEEVDAAGTLAGVNHETLEYHNKAADRHIEQTMVQQQEMQDELQPAPRPLDTTTDPETGDAAVPLAAALFVQVPASRASDRSQSWSTQEDYSVGVEAIPKSQCGQYTCPLKIWPAPWPDPWTDGGSDANLLLVPCVYTWSDLPALRIHLRLIHNMHSLCETCDTALAGQNTSVYLFDLLTKCQKDGCPSTRIAVGFSKGMSWLRLHSEKSRFAVEEPFELLSQSLTELSELYRAYGVAKPSYADDDLYGSSNPASAVDINQVGPSSRLSPAPERLYANDQNLGIAITAMGPYEHDSSVAPPVGLVDVNTSTKPGSSLLPTLVPNDQHRHVTTQQSTLANVPALHRELDSSVHDDIPNPRPDLLKVVVDVMKFLRGVPLGKARSPLNHCQKQHLMLLVARFYEATDTDPRVATADRDALWATCVRHYGAFWWLERLDPPHPFSKDLDHILRPLLKMRTHGVVKPVVTAWVACTRRIMKERCLSEVCSCDKYLEALRPYGDCVTALCDEPGPYLGELIFRLGDKIRLISRGSEDYWRGKCIRTGETGHLEWGTCF